MCNFGRYIVVYPSSQLQKLYCGVRFNRYTNIILQDKLSTSIFKILSSLNVRHKSKYYIYLCVHYAHTNHYVRAPYQCSNIDVSFN